MFKLKVIGYHDFKSKRITYQNMSKQKIEVKDLTISVLDNSYISLTDLAKARSERPAITIQNWIQTRSTINFLRIWEQLHNNDFKTLAEKDFNGFEAVEREFLQTTFTMYPSKWIAYTNAVGFQVKRGKYGGTWAHEDIALEFAAFISPEFKLYVLRAFKQLKEQEAKVLGEPFAIVRELTKANDQILKEAVEEFSVPPKLARSKKGRLYHAKEEDLINEIVYGETASTWKKRNPKKKGNLRDHATTIQLIIHNNLLSMDSRLLAWGVERDLRVHILLHMAENQFSILKENKAVKRLQERIELQKKLLE